MEVMDDDTHDNIPVVTFHRGVTPSDPLTPVNQVIAKLKIGKQLFGAVRVIPDDYTEAQHEHAKHFVITSVVRQALMWIGRETP